MRNGPHRNAAGGGQNCNGLHGKATKMSPTTKPPTALAADRDREFISDLQWWALSSAIVGDHIQVRGPRHAVSGFLWSSPRLMPGRDAVILEADIATSPDSPPVRVEIPADEVERYVVSRREPSGWVPVEERVAAGPGPLVERLARRVRAWRLLTTVRRGDVLSMVMEDRAVTGTIDCEPILSVDDGMASVLIPMRTHTGHPDVVEVPVTRADRVLPVVATESWRQR